MNKSVQLLGGVAPLDFGPIYAETDMTRFPVEPWNTFSNIIFLLIIIHFAIKTKLNWKKHSFIIGSLPILLIGYIGGTFYHATRNNNLWLYLDFMPIMVLGLFAAIYFLSELISSQTKAFLLIVIFYLAFGLIRSTLTLPKYLSIALGYGMLASIILAPLILLALKEKKQNFHLILIAMGCFATALSCRTIDNSLGQQLSPVGTHFLWHILGGLSVYFLIEYVFRRDLIIASRSSV